MGAVGKSVTVLLFFRSGLLLFDLVQASVGIFQSPEYFIGDTFSYSTICMRLVTELPLGFRAVPVSQQEEWQAPMKVHPSSKAQG